MNPTEPIPSADEQVWRALLGRKVSVRYRITGHSAHNFSEAIGMVQSIDSVHVKIVDRRGKVSEFALDDFVAGKVWT